MDLSYLSRSDREFWAQAEDTELRRAEIENLTRKRLTYFVAACLLFAVCIISTLCSADLPLFWVIFLLQIVGFQGVQNKLRLLQLAGQQIRISKE